MGETPANGGVANAGGQTVGAHELTVEERVRALAGLAAAGDARTRKSVVVALGALASPLATGTLCELLTDEDEGVRVLACQALGKTCDPGCLPSLAAAVHDASPQVRSGVVFVLASLAAHGTLSAEQVAQAFTPLVVMAFDPQDDVRADAAAALGTLRHAGVVEPLLVCAQDACPRVRANACSSLGLLDGLGEAEADEAEAMLAGLACDATEDLIVRISAFDGLARRAQRGLGSTGERMRGVVRAACEEARREIPADLVPRDEDEMERVPTPCDLRAMATWALGSLPVFEGDLALVAGSLELALRLAEESRDVWGQRYAISSLASLDGGAGVEALLTWRRQHPVGSSGLDAAVDALLEQTLATLGASGD